MGLFDLFSHGLEPNQGMEPAFLCSKDCAADERRIQSLLYLFRRLRINRLSAFSQGDTLKYPDERQDHCSSQEPEMKKWDSLYGKSEMEHMLLAEKERVLIDWPKNKFRSFCVFTKEPASRLLDKKRDITSTDSEYIFPAFKDYKDRKTSSFEFSIIPIQQQLHFTDLAIDLARLNFYIEHHSHISFTSRIQIAKEAICKCISSDLTNESVVILSEETHTKIISEFLSSLAFVVQLLRIYDLFTRLQPDQLRASPIKLSSSQKSTTSQKSTDSSSRPGSPVKVKQTNFGNQLPHLDLPHSSPAASPKKTLSPRKSFASLRAPRLTSKPSISNFQANEIYNPVAAPPTPERRNTHLNTFSAFDQIVLYDREVQRELWSKCKRGIEEKLRKEKEILESGSN